MAVTFTQTPTNPNGTQSSIVYVVNGLTIGPQSKYVCDIKDSGSADILVRLKQSPNNSNLGVFEISDILHDYIEYDKPFFTEAPITSSLNTKTFDIQFGEQTATSISSSVNISPNQIRDELVVYPAVTDYEEGLNWDSGSYVKSFLTNAPYEQNVRLEDWGTLSVPVFLNNSYFNYRIRTFDRDGNGLLTATTFFGFQPSTAGSKLVHIPIGPKNLPGLNFQTSNWAYYTIELNRQDSTQQVLRFNRLDVCSEDNATRFAFINRLGVFDYYTAELTNTEEQNFTTDTYKQSFIDYSTDNGLVQYDPSRRGEIIYNKEIQTNFTAQTNWLTKEESNWLMELFQSPSVFIQRGDTFLPVIIENTTERKKTNPRGQKLFTYQIRYRLANQKRSRR